MNIVKRSHVTIWNWIQKFHPKKKPLAEKGKRYQNIVDETVLKAGSENIWLWVATE
jgi:putative transposase